MNIFNYSSPGWQKSSASVRSNVTNLTLWKFSAISCERHKNFLILVLYYSNMYAHTHAHKNVLIDENAKTVGSYSPTSCWVTNHLHHNNMYQFLKNIKALSIMTLNLTFQKCAKILKNVDISVWIRLKCKIADYYVSTHLTHTDKHQHVCKIS